MLGELVLQGVAAIIALGIVGFFVAVVVAYPLSKTPLYNPTYTDGYGNTTPVGALDSLSVLAWLCIGLVATLAALGGIVEVIQWAV